MHTTIIILLTAVAIAGVLDNFLTGDLPTDLGVLLVVGVPTGVALGVLLVVGVSMGVALGVLLVVGVAMGVVLGVLGISMGVPLGVLSVVGVSMELPLVMGVVIGVLLALLVGMDFEFSFPESFGVLGLYKNKIINWLLIINFTRPLTLIPATTWLPFGSWRGLTLSFMYWMRNEHVPMPSTPLSETRILSQESISSLSSFTGTVGTKLRTYT